MHHAGLANAAADALSHPTDFPAHRRLVEALLRAGEPDAGAPSYAELWQHAAAEQQAAGMRDDVERSLELLVTEMVALSRSAPWFHSHPQLRAQAIEQAAAFWNGVEAVSSHHAHRTWERCWESRTQFTENAEPDLAGFSAAVAEEQRLQREWTAQWADWSQQVATSV